MKKFVLIVITMILLFCVSSCATSKTINKLDGPEDYYEVYSSTEAAATSEQNESQVKTVSDTKNSQTQETNKSSKSSPPPQTKISSDKKEPHKNNHSKTTNNAPAVENAPTSVIIEDKPLSQEALEDLSDDNWAKDESKVRLKKKDKETIKNSAPDDDNWGRE